MRHQVLVNVYARALVFGPSLVVRRCVPPAYREAKLTASARRRRVRPKDGGLGSRERTAARVILIARESERTIKTKQKWRLVPLSSSALVTAEKKR